MTDKKTRSRRFLVVGYKSGKWYEVYVKANNYEEAREKAIVTFNHPESGGDFNDAGDRNLHAVNLPE